jgi:hypothetical protein
MNRIYKGRTGAPNENMKIQVPRSRIDHGSLAAASQCSAILPFSMRHMSNQYRV